MTLGRLGIIAATNLIGVMLKPYCNSTFALMTVILFGKSCFICGFQTLIYLSLNSLLQFALGLFTACQSRTQHKVLKRIHHICTL